MIDTPKRPKSLIWRGFAGRPRVRARKNKKKQEKNRAEAPGAVDNCPRPYPAPQRGEGKRTRCARLSPPTISNPYHDKKNGSKRRLGAAARPRTAYGLPLAFRATKEGSERSSAAQRVRASGWCWRTDAQLRCRHSQRCRSDDAIWPQLAWRGALTRLGRWTKGRRLSACSAPVLAAAAGGCRASQRRVEPPSIS